MDKNAIKTFAVESRRKMIESVKFQASLLGITVDGIKEPISKAEGMETYDYGAGQHTIYDEDIKKRESLVREIKNKGFENVVEEVAYTWFNRIIAIRYMEVNDYLPTYTRVLSSEIEGKLEPDIITEALDLDLDYSDEDREKILKFKMDNDNDKLFQFLFIKQCNKLNEILPGLFEKTDDYMELLLDIKFTDEDSVVRQLVDTISEEDFKEQVEIIGWIYQFYNIELKDDTFKNIKNNKVPKERIPAATQLFTPDWIVKYMVENSVGRLWLEGHINNELKSHWNYFIDEVKQEKEVELKLDRIKNNFKNLNPEDIKVLDPSMGSGHILVYVFDVLMQIYISEGYTKIDAAELILKNNLFGLDIDDRAYQLAYFSILMKARKYNRKIFNLDVEPIFYSIKESNHISKNFINNLYSIKPNIKEDVEYILKLFHNAKEFGSILKVDEINFKYLKNELENLKQNSSNLLLLSSTSELKLLLHLVQQAEILFNKYDVVVTNPPYMGLNSMNSNLKNYILKNFPISKPDLFSVFIECGLSMVKENGFNCMVTMQSWMFLTTFENFRNEIFKKSIISNLLYMDNGVMGIAFGTSATVFRKIKLLDFKANYNHIQFKNLDKKGVPIDFPIVGNKNNVASLNDFVDIPGMPLAYWAANDLNRIFNNSKSLSNVAEAKAGLSSGDNNRFFKYWFEVNLNEIGFDFSHNEAVSSKFKWFPLNKGGSFRKWYGNHEYVINYENNGYELKNFKKATLRNPSYYFNKSIGWSEVSNGKISFRIYPQGFLFDGTGSSIFVNDIDEYYLIGFLNSNITQFIMDLISPTIHYTVGATSSLPLMIDNVSSVINLSKQNVYISKKDWDSYELSWNFKKHPFLKYERTYLNNIFKLWDFEKDSDFNKVKENEIELNEIFNKIYSLNINPQILDKYISISKPSYEKDIRSFISYAVGCMFGRYSLDEEGLQFAGGEFNINNYSKFIPDDDNIIPVLDTEYFNDDIVGRFVEFVKVCFGEETLEENLDFIAGALKKKGKTSREIIRNYFLTDFFKDHAQTYKKTPIYWQFDSGKQNAFKCLIYMHRYEPGLVARVRTDYLHKTQKAIEQNLANCESVIANSSNKSEVSKATKDKSKYIKQLDEIKVYDEALAHIANQRIEIDLDDGVKVNHAKFQNVEISKEGQKAKKINLLKKI